MLKAALTSSIVGAGCGAGVLGVSGVVGVVWLGVSSLVAGVLPVLPSLVLPLSPVLGVLLSPELLPVFSSFTSGLSFLGVSLSFLES